MSDEIRMTLLHHSTNDLIEELLMWRGLAAEHLDRITELSQAVGLITTLKPTMVMDVDHPLDMVREVAEHVTARIAELEAAQRWIPVSERLPEDRATILAAFKNREILTATYYKRYEGFGGVENYWHIEGWHSGDVTHWMPLPEPPEVQE